MLRSPTVKDVVVAFTVFYCVLVSIVAHAEPLKVTIEKEAGTFALYVNGKPFHIKGVGMDYMSGHNYQKLVESGGNSFRTWNTDNLERELQQAQKHGLKVAVGLGLKKQLQGFDYSDKDAVKKQYEKIIATVEKYKNHPAVLMWVVANEPNLLLNEQGQLAKVDPRIYTAINDIIEYIHENDPNHPVTYTFAGIIKEHIEVALPLTPNVDALSVQVYGDLEHLEAMLEGVAPDLPVIVTEYGPVGHWERPTTSWGREIEEPGGLKALGMLSRMEKSLRGNSSGRLIGDYSFIWGQKQERTPTWYGMVNPSGKLNARADIMTYYWTGKYPKNRAPLVFGMTINNRVAQSNVTLQPGDKATAVVTVVDPDGDDFSVKWEIMEEVSTRSLGGLHEAIPKTIAVNMISSTQSSTGVVMSFSVPEKVGEYRLFGYVYDNGGKVGNVNFPFRVDIKQH